MEMNIMTHTLNALDEPQTFRSTREVTRLSEYRHKRSQIDRLTDEAVEATIIGLRAQWGAVTVIDADNARALVERVVRSECEKGRAHEAVTVAVDAALAVYGNGAG